jgi:hypothetical protein
MVRLDRTIRTGTVRRQILRSSRGCLREKVQSQNMFASHRIRLLAGTHRPKEPKPARVRLARWARRPRFASFACLCQQPIAGPREMQTALGGADRIGSSETESGVSQLCGWMWSAACAGNPTRVCRLRGNVLQISTDFHRAAESAEPLGVSVWNPPGAVGSKPAATAGMHILLAHCPSPDAFLINSLSLHRL